MLELTTIKQTALDYLLSNLGVFPEDRHLFEVVGANCFDNNEWMVNISIVGLVGKYWNVFIAVFLQGKCDRTSATNSVSIYRNGKNL